MPRCLNPLGPAAAARVHHARTADASAPSRPTDLVHEDARRVSSGYGGAVYAYHSNVSINEASFFNNTASSGGAVGIKNGAFVVISASVFKQNRATSSSGGAVVVHGSDTIISASAFDSNWAIGDGGAMCLLRGADAVVSDLKFRGNTAGISGGAMSVFAGS